MDIEHKLDLIQQIHREQEENERAIYSNFRSKNYNRGAYGSVTYDFGNYGSNYTREQEQQDSWSASFRLRLLLAILLFLGFFIIEKKNLEFGEIDHVEIVEYIGKNMDI